VPIGVKVYCRERPTLNGVIRFHLRASVQLIGLSNNYPTWLDLTKEYLTLFKRIPLQSELVVHWKERDAKEGFVIDYNKVRYRGGVYQYILIDGVMRRVNADTDADGRIDYEMYDSTGDGIPDRRLTVSPPEFMLDWTKSGLSSSN